MFSTEFFAQAHDRMRREMNLLRKIMQVIKQHEIRYVVESLKKENIRPSLDNIPYKILFTFEYNYALKF